MRTCALPLVAWRQTVDEDSRLNKKSAVRRLHTNKTKPDSIRILGPMSIETHVGNFS